MLKKRGQSALEYIIILTAIVGAVLLGVSALGIKADKTADKTKGLGKLMHDIGQKIQTESQKIADIP